MPAPDIRVPVECYSRIVGYLRPVSSWNVAKVVEFHDRVPFAWPAAAEEQEDEPV